VAATTQHRPTQRYGEDSPKRSSASASVSMIVFSLAGVWGCGLALGGGGGKGWRGILQGAHCRVKREGKLGKKGLRDVPRCITVTLSIFELPLALYGHSVFFRLVLAKLCVSACSGQTLCIVIIIVDLLLNHNCIDR
jgi:hypothetical protein